jgi:DNA-binding transcriptional regulator YiaG
MVDRTHDCRKEAVVEHATVAHPYHFVEGGLPNVYLAGIDYRICRACKLQAAEIPALDDLMVKIARVVVRQESPLSGAEIRFLRKRLRKKSVDFANIIGVTPEHYCRLESLSEAHNPSGSADKLIRVYYSLLSDDEALKDTMNKNIDAYMASLHGEEQPSTFRAELHENKWEAEAVPA